MSTKRAAAAALAGAGALAAMPAGAHASVAFVQQRPVELPLTMKGSTTVEVLNGSPRARRLTLRVLGEAADEILVAPAEKPSSTGSSATSGAQAGEPAAFVLTFRQPPKAAASGELL